MDIKIVKPVTGAVSEDGDLTLDHFLAFVIGRSETHSHPRGRPSFEIQQVNNLNDLIRTDIGFTMTLTNEYGQPEQIRVAYSEPGKTLPAEFLRNFSPERLPEISVNPADPEALSVLKRVFVKEAAISSLAGFIQENAIPEEFLQQCRLEYARLTEILELIGELLAKSAVIEQSRIA